MSNASRLTKWRRRWYWMRAGKLARTAGHRFALGPEHRRSERAGARVREDERRCVRRAFVFDDTNDLRNDVAGALDDDGIADPDVLACDLILVVQRRPADHDAADRDRLELGDRRQGAGTSDLDVDAVEHGLGLLGRKLVRDRPARGPADHAEPLLQVEPIDLVDHAVDVVAEPGARLGELCMGRQRTVGVGAERAVIVDLEPPSAQPVEERPIGFAGRLADLAPGIGEEAELARCCDLRVELPQRPGRRIARIGVDVEAIGRTCRVERREILVTHIDLAAHLDDIGNIVAGKRRRDVDDRCEIGRDVLTDFAVAAGGAEHEATLLVARRGREAVDLRLGDHLDGARRVVLELLQEPPDTGEELLDVVVVERIAERQHRNGVADGLEALAAGAAPMRLEGLSARTRSGKRASMASFRRRSASYSASETVGAES